MNKNSYAPEDNNRFDGLDFEQIVDAMVELRKAIAEAEFDKPVLYFATSKFLPRSDRLIVIPKTDFQPEYLACHPDDYDLLTDKLKLEFTLIPVSKYQLGPPTEAELSIISEKIGQSIREILDKSTDAEFSIASKKFKNSLRSILEQSGY